MTLSHDTRPPRIDIAGLPVPEPYPDIDPHEAPPCDAAAECALLGMCLIYPQHVRALIKEDLFVFPEHRAILRAMRKALMRDPEINVAEFWLAVKSDVGYAVLRVLDLGEHANPKDIVYWLSRLERVHEARQLISDAQEQAEKAWRMDVDGARRVAARAATPSTSHIKDRLLSV